MAIFAPLIMAAPAIRSGAEFAMKHNAPGKAYRLMKQVAMAFALFALAIIAIIILGNAGKRNVR